MVSLVFARPPLVNPLSLISASRPAPGASLSAPAVFLLRGVKRFGLVGPGGGGEGRGGEDIVMSSLGQNDRNRKNCDRPSKSTPQTGQQSCA